MFATLKRTITRFIEAVNFQVAGGRWQLFELCDLWIVPDAVKHCCQNTLTAQWTKRLPILQQRAPADLAADAILEALSSIEDVNTADWTVIDFCSGAGGPVPLIETLVNRGRKASGKKPILFRLSDIHPNLDAWMEHAALSDNLSFVPQPVDASFPPFSVISTTTAGDKDLVFRAGLRSNGSKVFRLFCLAFHHFDDETAKRVIKSTLETSDAFAIVELQDRRIGSLVLMLLEFWLLLLVTVFWFWHDELHLLLTYALPILPAVHSWDGFVSCLRTRTFEETVRLVEAVQGSNKGDHALKGNAITVKRGDWMLSHSRTLHTWPIGYMEVTFGRKIGVGSNNGNE
ncbi:hypothetical protein LTR36_010723 [Oleoguttula mirabilis]|uniref:Uncharacterized protein n=1 Tax=Oleoguttula mirabilis TaxID=1507867 RepID=A0AAV9JSN1_9PEZI|nr:hypothetical protein LTR36_010723 [Oleoguttula mirabilis]